MRSATGCTRRAAETRSTPSSWSRRWWTKACWRSERRGSWTLVHPGALVGPALRQPPHHDRAADRRPQRRGADRGGGDGPARTRWTRPRSREAASLPGDRFDAGRDELIARRLLRSATRPGGGYQFHHQLVRRAVSGGRRAARAGIGRGQVGARPVAARRRRLAVALPAGSRPRCWGLLGDPAPHSRPQTDRRRTGGRCWSPHSRLGSDRRPSDSAAARSLYASAFERALSTRTPPPGVVRARSPACGAATLRPSPTGRPRARWPSARGCGCSWCRR